MLSLLDQQVFSIDCAIQKKLRKMLLFMLNLPPFSPVYSELAKESGMETHNHLSDGAASHSKLATLAHRTRCETSSRTAPTSRMPLCANQESRNLESHAKDSEL